MFLLESTPTRAIKIALIYTHVYCAFHCHAFIHGKSADQYLTTRLASDRARKSETKPHRYSRNYRILTL